MSRTLPEPDQRDRPPSRDRDQDAIFDLLGSRATHGGAEVRRHDTHAAAVFLAGDRALKVKRAVRFPFLDYSTLAKRKAACAAELEVNRRFAPRIYRRIVPITREPDGRLALDGVGTPIEWAVEMRRFDDNQTLDRLSERGKIDDELVRKLAAAIAAMHQNAEPVDAAPWLAALADYIAQNTAAFRENAALFPAATVADLDHRSRAALRELHALLSARGTAGLVRRGHGDLHLGNFAILDGEPVAFDAIEFDPVVASGDVLYDLAFLLMDLIERELPAAANGVLNGYFVVTRRLEDYDGLRALPFFMSLRAAIRAKVTAARLEQDKQRDSAETASSARRYFGLALELLKPVAPSLICVGGLSGTGKSVLARSLAPVITPVPGALLLRSDVERKAMAGIPETQRLPPEAYRPEMAASVYAALLDKAGRIMRAGHSVVVDAVFAKSAERDAAAAVAQEADAAFRGFYLTADLDIRLRRIGGRGPDASDADASVARQQEEFVIGPLNWAVIDATGSPARTLTRVRALLD
jgi:aminoglycoside phosphotransferase family enzyme/predicted kinase